MIEAVVFDMDGIIFDTEKLSDKAWERASEEFDCAEIMNYRAEFMGLNRSQTKKLLTEKFGSKVPFEKFFEFTWNWMQQSIQSNGLPVKPGLYELLGYLKKNGYKIAAATSTSRRYVMDYFERAEITAFFDGIVCGDMVEKSKPDPDIYLKAAALLQVEPQKCMALEDSPNGLLSANRAGMKTVMVPDMIEPTVELQKLLFACVPSLKEVIPLLQQEESNSPAD
jgi:HAD superfamily hydrolase (TIGR01509 family)